jgi:hypothetical protein
VSRGLGKIGRALEAAFIADADNAFTTPDLCRIAFPGANRIEKKHSVSVLRTVHGLLRIFPSYRVMRSTRRGNSIAVVNIESPASIGMAHLKHARRFGYGRNIGMRPGKSESELRAMIAPGGARHSWVLPGGDWWLISEIGKARLAGNWVEELDLESKLKRLRVAKIHENPEAIARTESLQKQPRLL